jgi:hypothetical protein
LQSNLLVLLQITVSGGQIKIECLTSTFFTV